MLQLAFYAECAGTVFIGPVDSDKRWLHSLCIPFSLLVQNRSEAEGWLLVVSSETTVWLKLCHDLDGDRIMFLKLPSSGYIRRNPEGMTLDDTSSVVNSCVMSNVICKHTNRMTIGHQNFAFENPFCMIQSMWLAKPTETALPWGQWRWWEPSLTHLDESRPTVTSPSDYEGRSEWRPCQGKMSLTI